VGIASLHPTPTRVFEGKRDYFRRIVILNELAKIQR
jgi:hypothetical protein